MAPARSNGILPVAASQMASQPATQNNSRMQKPANTRAAGPRLKVVVRRLAPALTEAEFLKAIGDEWKNGGGKVDWFSYKPGKDSKEYVISPMLRY